MINLNNLKKQRVESKTQEKLKPLTLGFDGESQLKVVQSNVKKKFKLFEEELKLSGFYTNFWMWNLIFLNVAISFILGFFVYTNYSKVSNEIGINLSNESGYDFVMRKEWLFAPSVIHLVLILTLITISYRSQKKLNHLFVVLFVQQCALVFFEFIGLRNLIMFFI